MSSSPFFIAAIGLGAGGHVPLQEFVAQLPPNPGIALIIVHHFNQTNATQMELLLTRHTQLTIQWAKDRQRLKANQVYLLPVDKTLTIHQGQLYLQDRVNQEQVYSVIDRFFLALAQDQKTLAIGIVLSGIGSDGSKGITEIHNQGGLVLVQDPDSALFASMPLSAILKDHPDRVLAPKQLANTLMKMIHTN